MKKLIVMTLLIVLAFSLCACAENGATGSSDAQNPSNAHTHSWVEATCTQAKTCTICQATEGSAKGHTPQKIDAVAATCTTAGNTEGSNCATCKAVLVEPTVVEAKGHDYQDRTCSVCGSLKASEGLNFQQGWNSDYHVAGIGTCTDTEIVIPDTYNGCPVTGIVHGAFEGCDEIVSVYIPDSVTTFLGNTFASCKNLTDVRFPNGLTKIASGTFLRCSSLKSVVIPDSVTDIEQYAFADCSSLTDIQLPNSLTRIRYQAFTGCSSLKSIVIPDSVTDIGEEAFKDCTSLSSIQIPDSVTVIESRTFAQCENLTSIIIPNSVVSIKGGAFGNCYSLTNITIPVSVTSIGNAFEYCMKLSAITYMGTIEQWNAIDLGNFNALKGDYYMQSGLYTKEIICLDGTIPLPLK